MAIRIIAYHNEFRGKAQKITFEDEEKDLVSVAWWERETGKVIDFNGKMIGVGPSVPIGFPVKGAMISPVNPNDFGPRPEEGRLVPGAVPDKSSPTPGVKPLAPAQGGLDTDMDGRPDIEDPNDDNDGFSDWQDLNPKSAGTWARDADRNRNGIADSKDRRRPTPSASSGSDQSSGSVESSSQDTKANVSTTDSKLEADSNNDGRVSWQEAQRARSQALNEQYGLGGGSDAPASGHTSPQKPILDGTGGEISTSAPNAYDNGAGVADSWEFKDKLGRQNTITMTNNGNYVQQVAGGSPYAVDAAAARSLLNSKGFTLPGNPGVRPDDPAPPPRGGMTDSSTGMNPPNLQVAQRKGDEVMGPDPVRTGNPGVWGTAGNSGDTSVSPSKEPTRTTQSNPALAPEPVAGGLTSPLKPLLDGEGGQISATSVASTAPPATKSTPVTPAPQITLPPTSSSDSFASPPMSSLSVDSNSGSCFPAGSMVMTPNGPKDIAELKEGDEVNIWNLHEGRLATSKITKKLDHGEEDTINIETSGGSIKTTAEHRFWTGHDWLSASKIKEGTTLFDSSGSLRQVTSVSPASRERVYNFHVDSPEHNYFVEGLLVHNMKMAE